MAPKGHSVNGVRVAQGRLALPGRPSQAEFAKRVGIHWVTQSNIENGKAKVSLELIEKIAKETGTTRDHLLGVDEEDEEAASVPGLSLFDDMTIDEFLRYRVGVVITDRLAEIQKSNAPAAHLTASTAGASTHGG